MASATTSSSKKSVKKKKKSTNVLEFLQSSLPRSTLLQLYGEETRGRFVCRAVLQRLPQVSQQILVRLSCCGGSFSLQGVSVWVKQQQGNLNADKNHPTTTSLYLDELYQWAILQHDPSSRQEETTEESVISLTEEFYTAFRASLVSLDAAPWTPLTPEQIEFMEREHQETSNAAAKAIVASPEALERYTQTQWDAVLHFLVGTPNLKVEPPPAVVHFLLETGLMQPDQDYRGSVKEDAPLVITHKGYDFMLQDQAQQVWHFVVQYMRSLESHKKYQLLRREALLFLICLSFARVGEPYAGANLQKSGRVLMKDLALFGLLYVRKIGKQSIFYPTRVALQLVGSHSSDERASSMWSLSSKALEAALRDPRPHDSSHLAIIVQTNFQICAYTTSELHVSMLGLFCDVGTIRRLPNVVFMVMTRDSVKAAFALGIQATQILRFLEKHAHPRLRSEASPLPSNVEDQIWLWDRERRRVNWTKVYQHQCLLAGEFPAVQQYTRDIGAHAWSSEARKIILVSYSHVERVQNFVRQWRAKTAARQQEADDL